MAEQETLPERVGARIDAWDWTRGAVGGFIAAVAFGLVMAFLIPAPLLEVVIPNMYGVEASPASPAVGIGWFFHLFHGVVLGLVYAAYAESRLAGAMASPHTLGGAIFHGILYGVVLTAVLPVLVMPLWLQAVDFAAAPSFPNVGSGTLMSLLGHLVYSVPLAVIYAGYRES